jgi:hypothetical protein
MSSTAPSPLPRSDFGSGREPPKRPSSTPSPRQAPSQCPRAPRAVRSPRRGG